MLTAELRSIVDAAPAVEGRFLVEQNRGIFAHIKRLGAGMDQLGHTGEPRRLSDVDGRDQINLKAGIDIVDVCFANRCRQMNHALWTSLLHCVNQYCQITDVAADHGQVLAGYMPDVVRSRGDVEERDFIASFNQLPCRMSTDQTRACNQNPHPSPSVKSGTMRRPNVHGATSTVLLLPACCTRQHECTKTARRISRTESIGSARHRA